MRSSCLYVVTHSEREGAPDFSCPPVKAGGDALHGRGDA
jgi:hypothetical protein